MPPIEDRIGISTHFLPSTHGEDIFDAIRLVADAGFSGFEIVPTLDQAQLGYPENHPNVGLDLFEATDADFDRLADALQVFEWTTVHSPHLDWNLASANRHLRRLTWDCYDKCIELALRLKSVAMTFHMGGATFGFQRDEQVVWDLNLDYAQHALDLARPHNLPIGFEVGGFDMLKFICDQVPGWGINMDIGHAYMSVHDDEPYFRFFDEFKGRIAEIHHNGVNHYWGRYMEHQPPHLNNTIDFTRTYGRLRDDGYAGPIVCEIQGMDIPQVIRHCQESKDMICRLWNEALTMPNRWYEL